MPLRDIAYRSLDSDVDVDTGTVDKKAQLAAMKPAVSLPVLRP